MKIRQGILLSALATAASASCADIDQADHATEQRAATSALAERQQLAASGRYLAPRDSDFSAASADTMANALDIPTGQLVSAKLFPPNTQSARDLPAVGIIKPRRGTGFALMSTGLHAGNVHPEPGTDLGAIGADGDVVTLTLRLRVPPGVSRMYFDYNFLSAESPDFLGSDFNDTFSVRVTDSQGPREPIVIASVNDSYFHDVSTSRAGGTGYDIYVPFPSGVDADFNPASHPGMQMFPDAGLTDFQSAPVEVPSGEEITVEFAIRDLGDGLLDSAVIIDNLRFTAIDVVDANDKALRTDDGVVRSAVADYPTLASAGRPVSAVAADGSTQLLLRAEVPGPGRVQFGLPAENTGDGQFASLGSADWQSSATVEVVEVEGRFYGFAVYRSPADFNRGTHATARKRTLGFAVTYELPEGAGTGIQYTHSMEVVRPPVVIVHDIWSKCLEWEANALYLPPQTVHPFTVTCAEYGPTSAKGIDTNVGVVPAAIVNAIENLRDSGAAATQVDLIGHGMGGLLARRYFDDPEEYFRADNFNEGDVHRFISMNTPHLGMRMASDIVDFRKTLKDPPPLPPPAEGEDPKAPPPTWATAKAGLAEIGVFIDSADEDTAIDDMGWTSPVIQGLRATSVPSHVMISTNGKSIGFLTSGNVLAKASRQRLYRLLEQGHPLALPLPWQKKPPAPLLQERTVEDVIFGDLKGLRPGESFASPGDESLLFCRDDHDLLVTTDEQRGGVTTATAISSFPINPTSLTNHYLVHLNAAHTTRLVELLNSSMASNRFVSLPAPVTVPPTNSCPPRAPGPSATASTSSARPLATGSLAIVSPSAGTVVTAGSTVSVVIEGTGGFTPENVVLVASGRELYLETGPFVVDFQVPADAIGSLTLSAYGLGANGGMASSERVHLVVQVPATLESLDVLNGDAVLTGPGATRQLTVLGNYSDDVRRDVTSGVGTIYSSSNISIATISSDGLITALAPGVVTVTMRNGVALTSINVKVKEGSVRPSARCRDVTVGANASCQAQASIDAGSSDPDGLPEPLVLVQTPPGPFGLGAHTVTLTASDGADTDTCQATVTVVDSSPPALAGCEDITAAATPGLGGAYVSYTVTGSDSCSGSVPATCNIASGSFFALGESVPVTCTATDSSGNGATCTFSVQVDEPATCDISLPRSQDYWRTQCNYRAPDGTPPDPALTADNLQRLLDQIQGDLQAVCEPTEPACHALNPDPYWDVCEQACQHYAGLLLNIASARAPSSCCTVQGTSADTAAYVAALIAAGECHQAISIAADFNTGCMFCGSEH